jgi:hypothetical protein
MVLILAGVAPIKNRSLSTSTNTSSAERFRRTRPVIRMGSQLRLEPCTRRSVQKLTAIATATTKRAVTHLTQLSSSATSCYRNSELFDAVF